MRKFSLIVSSLMICILMSGCTIEKEEEVKVKEQYETVIESESSSSEVEPIIVEFTNEKLNSISDYLSRYNYIEFSQTMKNSTYDNSSSVSTEYLVKADTQTKVTESIILKTDENNESSKQRIIRDYVNQNTCYYSELEDKWYNSTGTTPLIVWDLVSYNNDLDIYNFLVGNIPLEIGTKGTQDGDYEYYEVITEAQKGSLYGVSYDSLGNQITTYVFKNLDGYLVPDSVIVEIDYTVGSNTYYVNSVINFNMFGDISLNMP